MNVLRSWYVLAVAACAVALSAIAAQAQTAPAFDIRKIPAIPDVGAFAPGEFEALSGMVEDVPMNDPALGYRLRLPRGWQKAEDAAAGATNFNRQIIGDVARYYGPPTGDIRSNLEVMTVELKDHITMKNWFVNHVLQNGYNLQGLNAMENGRVEALFVMVDKDVSYVVRAAAQMNGARIMMAMYYVPWQFWNDEKAVQGAVISSFQPTAPAEEAVEEVERFTFLDLAQFDYPMSWSLRAPEIRDLERMSAIVIHDSRGMNPNGWIEVKLISRLMDTTLAEEVALHRKAVETQGFEIGDLIEPLNDLKLRKEMSFGATEIYAVHPKDQPHVRYEMWLSVMTGPDFYYIVSMLTPSRESDFYVWALNSEGFQIVATTLGDFEEDSYYDPKVDARKDDKVTERDMEREKARHEREEERKHRR